MTSHSFATAAVALTNSGWSTYSPISTLEKQYALGAGTKRVFLFVQCNANCCLAGGVESILKHVRVPGGLDTSLATEHIQPLDTAAVTSLPLETSSPAADPFSFLNEDEGATSSTLPEAVSTQGGSRSKNPFGFIRKVAQNTTKTLERGIHTLAIRADQGRNPDLLAIGLYDSRNVVLSMSESQLLPYGDERHRGLSFRIPLVVPGWLPDDQTVFLRLWIRSGAALLQQAKASKHFLIGSASFNVGNLRQQVANNSVFLKVTLQSAIVADGALFLCVTRDLKHPKTCDLGWSLVDPDVTAYHLPNCMFNLPLDASYAFHLPIINKQSSPLVVATERTTESAIVLPLATAWAQLVQSATLVSLQHAQSVLTNKLEYSRHDTAVGPEHVTVQLGLAFCRPAAVDAARNSFTISANTRPHISLAWQRPDSIFETDLLQPTRIPVIYATPEPGQPSSEQIVANVRFSPKPVRTNILPALLKAYGGSLPHGSGFLLGNVRMQIDLQAATHSLRPGSSTTGGNFSTSSVYNSFGSSMSNNNLFVSGAGNPFANVTSLGNPFAYSNSTSNSLVPVATNQSNGSVGTSLTTGYEQKQENNQDVYFGESIIRLDDLLQNPPPVGQIIEYPLYDKAKRHVGTIGLTIAIQLQHDTNGNIQNSQPLSAKNGLVSLVGLMPLPNATIPPMLDFDSIPPPHDSTLLPQQQQQQQQQAQLATMGNLISHTYLLQHISCIRQPDYNAIQARTDALLTALVLTPHSPPFGNSAAFTSSVNTERPQPCETRMPRPFRPSSSRNEPLLSGLPFNVHTATMTVRVMDSENTAPSATRYQNEDLLYNTTCGAPSDHYRDFGNIFSGRSNNNNKKDFGVIAIHSPLGPVSGGLRRLETKRIELADHVAGLRSQLLNKILNFFQTVRQMGQNEQYIPARHHDLNSLRSKLTEAAQALHHVTWNCAVRRANVFSQALGIAISTYLTAVSDPSKWQSTWPSLWINHGFLISFEGLLSAAGKELGMIEDASVGIQMLRIVRVVLMPDDGSMSSNTSQTKNCIPVPGSPFLKWVCLIPGFDTSTERSLTLQIGIATSYFEQRIPAALKNGALVRLFPLLFEVGVDIRQWGANVTGSLDKSGNTSRDVPAKEHSSSVLTKEASSGGLSKGSTEPGLIDDEDDDVGVLDEDVLVQLNYEAFQQLNTYAHLISPANSRQSLTANKISHPLLETLYQHIVSSAGKMNHAILLEASLLIHQLGGTAAVFCKSGKDRTAMHITYKQAKFINEFCSRVALTFTSKDGVVVPWLDSTAQDATMIRVYGTRLAICEKNVGQALYAFNSLQVRFMPEALQPPVITLAGFLKGGKVFTGGAIES